MFLLHCTKWCLHVIVNMLFCHYEVIPTLIFFLILASGHYIIY
jgi:hypothetical protein